MVLASGSPRRLELLRRLGIEPVVRVADVDEAPIAGEAPTATVARLAAATPQEEGDEDDEDALGELEEFVRVAALLLHGDCVLAPRHRQQLN